MYLDFFSFERPPFRITPDPSLFYPGDEQGRGVVLDALIYGITSGEGILKVVGEVGSGKTMLCRMLEEKLPDNVEIVYLANPSLTARDIVYAISFDLKLPVTPETDRLIVMQKLQEYLVQKHSQGGTVVVFIEEAQSMPLETLEEIRLLSNLETRQNKLMQIVLFGQPELDKLLLQKSIRQLRERITHSFNLQPLSVEATRDYLRFRLRAAGCPWPQLFSPRAEKMLAKASSGLTRRINILADKSLLAAYADSSIRMDARNSKGQIQAMVLPRHVRTAIKDSGYQEFSSLLRPVSIGVAVVIVAALLVLAGRFLWPEADRGLVANFQETRAFQPEQTLTSSQESTVNPGQNANERVEEVTVEVSSESLSLSELALNVEEEPDQATHRGEVPQLTEQLVSLPGSVEVLSVVEQEPDSLPSDILPVPEAGLASENDAQGIDGSVSVPLVPEEDAVVDKAVTDRSPGAVDARDESSGLIDQRMAATRAWLQTIPDQGYTVQLLSVSRSQDFVLLDFLELMSAQELIDESYICSLSVNGGNVPNRLVIYGEFQGLSLARQFINSLPDEVAQYAPFVRNLNDISCTNQL